MAIVIMQLSNDNTVSMGHANRVYPVGSCQTCGVPLQFKPCLNCGKRTDNLPVQSVNSPD